MSRRQDGLMAKLLDGFMAMAMWRDGNSPSIHLTIDEMAIWWRGYAYMAMRLERYGDLATWFYGFLGFGAKNRVTGWYPLDFYDY